MSLSAGAATQREVDGGSLPARADEGTSLPREAMRLSARTYLSRGLEFLERPRPEDQAEAERLLRKALSLEPDLADAHAGLARISVYLYSLGLQETEERLETALREAQLSVDLAPGDAAARSALALALAVADRLTPAEEEARRAVALDADEAEAHVALGIVLRLRRQLDEAEAACRRAAAIAPDSPRVLVPLAHALREKEMFAAAMELYGQAIDLDHEAIVPQLGAAGALVRAGALHSAAMAFRTLTDEWDYARDRVLLGSAALMIRQHRYAAALQRYDRIELPDNGSVTTLLTLYGKGFCLMRMERPAEAEYFLSTLIERAPDDYDGPAQGREFLFRAYEDLVRYFEGRGRDRKVEKLLRAACRRPLAPTRLGRELARMLSARGQTEEGAAVLERAILASDPLEDLIDLSESALALARLRAEAGQGMLADDTPAARALQLVAERLVESRLGVVHYRMARAYSLARHAAAALASLARARANGYLPTDLIADESDFDFIRNDEEFLKLVQP